MQNGDYHSLDHDPIIDKIRVRREESTNHNQRLKVRNQKIFIEDSILTFSQITELCVDTCNLSVDT